jgi:hypothetical protein
MMFFVSSSWATKFRSENKKSLEENFKKGNMLNQFSIEKVV